MHMATLKQLKMFSEKNNMGENYSVLKDIPYGNHERHKIDIYIPENPWKNSGVIL